MKLPLNHAAILIVAALGLVSATAEGASTQCQAVREQYPDFVSKHVNIAVDNATPGLVERSTSATKGWTGFIPDMLAAFSECLGFDYSLTGTVFPGSIESVVAGRFDLLAGDLRPTEARQKRVRFLQYIISPARYITQYGNPKHIKTRLDLCGLRAAAIPGDTEIQYYDQISAECKSEGKPGLNQITYSLETQEYSSITNGQTDVFLAGASNLARFVKTHPNTVEAVLAPEKNTMEGWILNKQETGLAKAFLAVMKVVQEDGTMEALLKKNGLAVAGVRPTPAILLPPVE